MITTPMTVIPKAGFDFARFGETRASHRSRLGEYEAWRPDQTATADTDLYLPSLVSLAYDDTDRLNFIEVVNDDVEVLYEGVQLLNRPEQQVVAALTALIGLPPIHSAGMYAVPELGMRLRPDYDDELDDYAIKFIGLMPEETYPGFQR
ncbi:hypothetical protein [Glycomyces tritici]|uniref:Uncharacterized protein n=1 Tax=Glycomyces tritici TaxID=2665176 RepID=A0ABT7YR85_9ACTN|nr:hypothetical protein [Glycomyces tritici]MDN3241165.1 hypothetical protein [Glycomyces tritici]